MITDPQTNKLYLADTLPMYNATFFKSFEKVLLACGIDFEFIPNTKDVWAVDFMPIQLSEKEFIQFRYEPDYLQTLKDIEYQSDTEMICREMGIKTKKSDLKVDGGNIVTDGKIVLMCDKVFAENKHLSKSEVISKLKESLLVETIHFLPQFKDDIIGHADGMVRFAEDGSLLINDMDDSDKEVEKAFYTAIEKIGIDYHTLPYALSETSNFNSAEGIYLNYLQLQNYIFVPQFGQKEDADALEKMQQYFPNSNIQKVNCTHLAKGGGILNCISWNILS
ncbi:MAG: agmatine deiminase family protein [Chitinophagaceae bacterium]|nr:agmatine deiminase family protein [Chitinophagaceae bacterium]